MKQKVNLSAVHTGNAIKDKEGNIIVIDPIMRLNTEAQGYGGKRKTSNKISPTKQPQSGIKQQETQQGGKSQ